MHKLFNTLFCVTNFKTRFFSTQAFCVELFQNAPYSPNSTRRGKSINLVDIPNSGVSYSSRLSQLLLEKDVYAVIEFKHTRHSSKKCRYFTIFRSPAITWSMRLFRALSYYIETRFGFELEKIHAKKRISLILCLKVFSINKGFLS